MPMQHFMSLEPPQQRILLTHAPPEAFAPLTLSMLAKLGYAIMSETEFAERGHLERPELRIVDERGLAEVPEGSGSALPIVVLTGRHGVTGVDPRIVGAVRRPAGMHELYRLVQAALEDTPRTAPRVATHLVASCQQGTREWRGAVLTLSESGCLMRIAEPLVLGACFRLSFELPRSGRIGLDAEIAYQLVPDVGVIFNSTSPADRQAIAAFVNEALASV